jgi:Dyp-type peroxidase family
MYLNRANIQGNILQGYTHPFAAFLFFRVEEAAGARGWLREIIDQVTNAERWDIKPATTLNVMFSSAGLEALGLPDALIDSFAREFQDGMASRAHLVGDTGEESPEHWEDGLGTPDIHLLVSIYASTPDGDGTVEGVPPALTAKLAWLAEVTARTGGVRLLFRHDAARLRERPDATTLCEHFGFVDGIGQPALDEDGVRSPPGDGAPAKRGSWRPLKCGEFLLGYADEDGVLPPAPDERRLAQDGTYVVYRRLRQDVAAFRQFLSEQAYSVPGGEEALAARIVGRWRDGTPVTLSPHRPDPALAQDAARNNDFRYGHDADGWRCPIGAHIRRSNPRDALPFGAQMVNRHRIIRRGIPYGPPLPEGTADDGVDRGILFICFQASIERQFEFVQAQWLNDGNKLGLGRDADLFAGGSGNGGKMTLQGSPPRFLSPLRRFVTMKGGEYFYMPGIAGLHYLAGGRP